jgi:pyruvate dehydrogenase E2 component (dihydrolipoamide acetyltransferase)
VGDRVNKGDVIFEIETDKATLEMESPSEGFVKRILVENDQTLLIGEPMMILGDEDEEVAEGGAPASGGDKSAPAAEAAPSSAVPAAESQTAQAAPAPESPKPRGRIMASPRAKKAAKELGVDLSTLRGTGPAGKITEVDVKNAAGTRPGTAPAPEPAAEPAAVPPPRPAPSPATEANLGSTVSLNRLQRITAERMLKSKQEIPCFYLTVKVDMTDLVAHRAKVNEAGGTKVAFNDFILKAVATGLEKFPLMTGQLAGDAIKLADAIHIGLAISVPDGLVAPLVKDVNTKNVRAVAQASQALIERARSNKLDLSDLEGGCITVSNLGGFGIDSFIPIVVPGQCSILGIGQITDTCVPDNGNILIRKLMNMTLSVDHKVANGAYAAQFLDLVKKMLEDPSQF